MVEALRAKGLEVVATGEGPCFQLHFQAFEPTEYRDTLAGGKAAYAKFLMGLLDAGVYALPDGRWYLSAAHGESEIEGTLEAVRGLMQM